MKKYFFLFFLISSNFACNQMNIKSEIDKDDIVLAKLNNEVLLYSQIPNFQIQNLNKEDSITFLKSFVSNWLKEEAFVQKAKENLQNFNEINQKTKQFNNDLIRSSYEKKVLESLEIEITEEDLETYYQLHKEYFTFKEDYYELKYISLPKNTSGIQQIRKNISENKPSAFVTSYCKSNPEKCHLDERIFKNETYLEEKLKLQKNALIVSTRFKYFYPSENTLLIYKILSKKAKGEIAPLELVKNEVSILALEKKKQEYLQDLEDKTYQKAKNDKIFENYID